MADERAIDAIIAATGFSPAQAEKVLMRLEAQGLTIYKKKVARNGRRPAASQPLTPELKQKIKLHYMWNPDHTQQEIANIFNVNIGRVNEALDD